MAERRTKRTNIPADVRRRVRDRYLNCYYCGEVEQPRHKRWPPRMGHEIDHLVALELGGTDDEDNLVVACGSCNRSKQDKTVAAFAHWLQTVIWPRFVPGWRQAFYG